MCGRHTMLRTNMWTRRLAQQMVRHVPRMGVAPRSRHMVLARAAHTTPVWAKGAASSTPTYRAGELRMVDYHRMIDHSLDTLTSQLEELMETHDIDALEEKVSQGSEEGEWDVEYATGVINVRLGSYGTYVINKQPPTQQLWLSSPTSGPKRFDYDTDKGVWFTYRDGELFLFHELLSRELSAVFDTPLSLHL